MSFDRDNLWKYAWLAVLGVLLILHGAAAFYQPLISDEFETIATAKFIFGGKVIFRDFFQHHGTIPYFLYSLAFLFSKSLTGVIFRMKIISFLLFCLTIYVFHKTAAGAAGGKYRGIAAVIPVYYLLNDIVWWRYGMQVRVDTLMTLFLLLFLLSLLRYQQKGTALQLVTAGLFSGAAFFSKQSCAPVIIIFIIFFFGLDLKKYFYFALGNIFVWAVHIIYFAANGALGDFFRYFLLFNFMKSPLGSFTLNERLWFFSSSVTPFYIKALYVLPFLSVAAVFAWFFRDAKRLGGRFFVALFIATFANGFLTPLWKTPYPQYYLPLQVMFVLVGAYYLICVQRMKKFYLFCCSVIISFLPFVTLHYFRSLTPSGVTYSRQVSVLQNIKNILPSGSRIVGGLYTAPAAEPAGYHWFYPPIFVDLDMSFLVKDLDKADIVFYDSNLCNFATLDFKRKLFRDFHFAGQYITPYSQTSAWDICAVFARSPALAEKLKGALPGSGLETVPETAAWLANPVYFPVYFEAGLSVVPFARPGGAGVNNPARGYQLPRGYLMEKIGRNENAVFKGWLSTQPGFFEDRVNELFPSRPEINCGMDGNRLALTALYREGVSIRRAWSLGSLGLRESTANRPLYKGLLNIGFNRAPERKEVSRVEGGCVFELEFGEGSLEIKTDSYEVPLDKGFTPPPAEHPAKPSPGGFTLTHQ